MALKGRLRALEARVRWLETEGLCIYLKGLGKFLELAQDTSDLIVRSPAFAARWKAEGCDGIPLPPPRVRERKPPPATSMAEPVRAPLPVVAARSAPVPEPVPAPAPTLVPARAPEPASRPVPVVEAGPLPPPTEVARAGPDPPVPEPPVPEPQVAEPPSDLQIRPVRWRHRTLQDDLDDSGHDFTKCLTDYDVMRAYGDDYDDG